MIHEVKPCIDQVQEQVASVGKIQNHVTSFGRLLKEEPWTSFSGHFHRGSEDC